MSKHTPGPWRLTDCLDVDLTNEVGICYGANAQYVVASRNGLIGENDLRAMRNANARLIAAAPELLEALTKMVERITYYAELKEGDIPNIEDWAYTYNSGDMASARAAIAKAAGGAE